MAEYKAKQFPSKADAAKFVKSNNIKDFIMEGTLENGEYMLRYKTADSTFKVNVTDSEGKSGMIPLKATTAVDAAIMAAKLPHVKSVRSVDAGPMRTLSPAEMAELHQLFERKTNFAVGKLQSSTLVEAANKFKTSTSHIAQLYEKMKKEQ